MSQVRNTAIIAVTALLTISLIDLAYAQIDTTNSTKIWADNTAKIDEFDDLLIITLPGIFIGASLTGSAFLLHMLKNAEENKKTRLQLAKNNFVVAFIMFLICVILIFIFDLLEIISERLHIQILILDIVITYGFFGAGLTYLIRAARQIYKIA